MRYSLIWAALALAATVAPQEAVITIDGFCSTPQRSGQVCKTVVTRAEFEKLTEALQPGMSPGLRLKVAQSYARMLRMAAVAEQRGLDATPAFAEEMRFARLQLLAQDLTRALEHEAGDVSDADIETYYELHASAFETASLARIFVPRAATDVAAELRERAAAGEDPDELQLEANTAAGIAQSSPARLRTTLDDVRRASLPPSHEPVMDMKPGEVSEVFSDPAGGHFIYKLLTKTLPALATVRAEIHAEIAQQRSRDKLKPFEGGVVLSDAYFAR